MQRASALVLWLASLTACSRAAAPPVVSSRPTAPLERVVIVSVDGLRPADCARLPILGELARQGAFAVPPDGALSVMPSVTYPAHTSMVTGVTPRRHGITTNSAPDPSPDGKNKAAWRWFRSDVRVPTLYDAAFDAGLRTVLLHWPVTVGARATANIPEFWMPGVEDDVKLLRLLATPGAFERIERRYPDFAQRYTPGTIKDPTVIDAALALLAAVEPNLMLVHIIEVDGAQHEFGPDSPEAERARQSADVQVGRLLEALRAAPLWPSTVLAVVSDHGFLPIAKQLAPRVWLAERGLQDRVWMLSAGGSAFFYLHRPDDAEAATVARQLFDELARDPSHGIARVLGRDELAVLGGDADAFLAVEAAPGFSVSGERSGEAVSDGSADYRGTHGYVPERPEMRATMLFAGPKLAPSVLRGARLIDLAPTVAGWLGLQLTSTEGVRLPVTLASAHEPGP